MAKHNIHSPLTFNVSQLMREEIGARRDHPFAEDLLELHEHEVLRDITGTVRLTRTLVGVYVEASVTGMVTTQCVRCLQPAYVRVDFRFTEEYVATVDATTGVALNHPEAEDDAFVIDEHHLLDLGLAVREYTLLELPMRPLCKADCRGLCAGCGVDLNVTTCQCHQEAVDERFSALKALLDQSSE
jgi:uncharacterized protein